ncbi:MAG: hypothetical protein FWC47_03060 [Oscillospiraceae bacterium]|nr:hypothetical protein [Oscillospiraceae bacterium]
MTLVKVYKTNAAEVVYETMNYKGNVSKKKQSFNCMAYDCTDEDFYELASAVGKLLAYAPKEILKNTVVSLMEG